MLVFASLEDARQRLSPFLVVGKIGREVLGHFDSTTMSTTCRNKGKKCITSLAVIIDLLSTIGRKNAEMIPSKMQHMDARL